MAFPKGTIVGKFSGTLEDILSSITHLTGVLYVTGKVGEGFLLVDRGKVTTCVVVTTVGEFKGNVAYELVMRDPTLDFVIRKYTAKEYLSARDFCAAQNLLIAGEESGSVPPVASTEWNLDQLQRQPGVLAVSVFHDGFSVQSTGKADFDQVAAVAEDLLRAGRKIAEELAHEPLDQIILETPVAKFIIAPYGDINLCVLTESAMNLGLIRTAIRNIQSRERPN